MTFREFTSLLSRSMAPKTLFHTVLFLLTFRASLQTKERMPPMSFVEKEEKRKKGYNCIPRPDLDPTIQGFTRRIFIDAREHFIITNFVVS